ncbi:MAG TPA: hypothetical protein VG871_22155 [Vicinamibacterales bacterium]|nr:hypothetical protein [Vicinamibacterales bacterium]
MRRIAAALLAFSVIGGPIAVNVCHVNCVSMAMPIAASHAHCHDASSPPPGPIADAPLHACEHPDLPQGTTVQSLELGAAIPVAVPATAQSFPQPAISWRDLNWPSAVRPPGPASLGSPLRI